jgi:hypothetical protein
VSAFLLLEPGILAVVPAEAYPDLEAVIPR